METQKTAEIAAAHIVLEILTSTPGLPNLKIKIALLSGTVNRSRYLGTHADPRQPGDIVFAEYTGIILSPQ